MKNISGGDDQPPGGVGRAPRPHSSPMRVVTAAAALLLAAGGLLVACGDTSPRRATPISSATSAASSAENGATTRAATLRALLARVLPDARLLTAVDLRSAREQLGLAPDTPVGATGRRRGELTQFGLLVLPLVDDRVLFAGLDLSRISAAVQFGGVEHSGLLIGTSQSPSSIAAGLMRAGWRPAHGGFRYSGAGGDSELAESKVDLFDGGLVLAYKAADADRAAAQTRVPRSDRRLISLIDSSTAPARFAAVDSGCLASEVAQERLAPHVGSITITPRGRPRFAAVTIGADARALAGAGLVVVSAMLRGTQIVIDFRYAPRATAPAGAVIEVARVAPLYRCRGG